MNDVAVENEKNLVNETTTPIPTPMMKPAPAATVGTDGITTVSINATAAPPATVVNPNIEIKKGNFISMGLTLPLED